MNWRLSSLIHVCRSLLRYWGLSMLNICGLAIGFAATIVISLYARDELTFDRFIPGADHVYLVTAAYGAPGKPLVNSDKTPAGLARWLPKDAPEIDAVARLHAADALLGSQRHETHEHFYWADENIFSILHLAAIHGDLATALSNYDTVVLTQEKARFYFGRDDVVGQTLILNRSVRLTVTAVLADFPPNTHLDCGIFVAGKAGYAMLADLDIHPDWLWDSSYTYVRLKPGTTLGSTKIDQIARDNWIGGFSRPVGYELVRVTDLHFSPEGDSQMKPRGHLDTVIAMIAVACLILILAITNVAGLMTVQIDERNTEMAVRNALGAQKHHLVLQIICEAAIINFMGLIAALALTERLLPHLNSLLGIKLMLWSSPGFLIAIAVGMAILGTAGALYPALRLSPPPPSREQRGSRDNKKIGYLGRMGWITVQSCLLVTLLVSSHTVLRQWTFAMDRALNFDGQRVVLITVSEGRGQDADFKRQVLATPGVEGAARSRYIPVYQNIRPGWFANASGQLVQFTRESVDTDFFRFYGVRVLAGRGFSTVYNSNTAPDEVIINKAALQAFGYRTPQQAVGRLLSYKADGADVTSSIIGVVDDMRTATVREPLSPMVFDSQSKFFTMLGVRITQKNRDRTLAALDQVWRRDVPDAGPIELRSFWDYLQDQYRDMLQQWRAFAMLSLVGICLNVLGLSGLSIYLARARLREMAIRNALGAQRMDIFRLRLAPFVKPLIIANLAAALISWLLMSWWLSSFKAHISLSPLSFVGAGGLTVLITLLTLATHIFLSAPARSSQPLRAD